MQNVQLNSASLNTLNQQSLSTLPADVDVPKYDRSKLTAGIVHIGVGGFHRAHQAMYVNELLKTPGSESWAICGVGLLEANRGLRDVLVKQDYLYSLTVRHPNGQIDHQVIGSMIDFLFAPENKQQVIDKLVNADTKIVSLTITEGGYNFNPATGEFDYTNPEIIHDMANFHDPITAFGYITAALKQRKALGMKPFTVQSCDNVQHNGDMIRKMLLAFVSKIDAELGQWIEANVAFPNAMVDRITPVTTKADIEYVAKTLHINDEWPITCEAFTQWVIEDNFSDSRPAFDNAGAQFVADVTPFEKMKIRLLNAGHSVLGLLGSIHGFATIDEAVSDPLFATYLRKFMDDEVTPLIEQLPGIDLNQYKDTLIERFANPNIKDSLARICLESSAKLPKFIIASINENIALNRDTSLACLVIATWCLYSDKQVNQQGEALEINDQMAAQLHQFASKTEQDPLAFLQLTDLFGDLNNQATFCKEYLKAIADLYAPNSDIKAIMQARLQAKS
ncbi:mannitol dehydrogenase family protein [Shewanella saliphila]|uniref:Mannitol 2-dehydrogenase n=1 Tax=Shewanella saliphila TaxID=2282698 RepID=A0ABQ2Q859_9GAMM|nr:mannitol dehydrogenase family protein [Shewanella saliphila]MCL1102135.1 mannitol dehydrogenase family protein [Shewanella saliphila]GGP58432.1 mannitol 2-dehydrogenase [Shewanella saliphila]